MSCSCGFCDIQLVFIICHLFPMVNGLLQQEICYAQTILTLLKVVHAKKFDRSLLNVGYCIIHVGGWEKMVSVRILAHEYFIIHVFLPPRIIYSFVVCGSYILFTHLLRYQKGRKYPRAHTSHIHLWYVQQMITMTFREVHWASPNVPESPIDVRWSSRETTSNGRPVKFQERPL